jgi:RNA polymerase sigma factor (TIGR02999 family)
MGDISLILAAIEHGDTDAVAELLRLVHHELRGLAAKHMAHEAPGHTLQASALVNEVYLRLFGKDQAQHWDNRGHFFAAASEAMRRILVESARHKKRLKRGGSKKRVDLDERMISVEPPDEDLLALDEALKLLIPVDPTAAEMVKLRYFSGLSTEEAAAILGLSERAGYRVWKFAKAWLYSRIHGDDSPASGGAQSVP